MVELRFPVHVGKQIYIHRIVLLDEGTVRSWPVTALSFDHLHHMFVIGSKNFGKLDHLFQRRISVTCRDDEMLSRSVLTDANPVQGSSH